MLNGWELTDLESNTYILTSRIVSYNYNDINIEKQLNITDLNNFTQNLGEQLNLYEELNGFVEDYNIMDYADCTIVSANITNENETPNKLIMVVSSTLVSDAFNILYNKYDTNTANNFNINGMLKRNFPQAITGYVLNTTSAQFGIKCQLTNSKLNITGFTDYQQFNILNIKSYSGIKLYSENFKIYCDEKINVLSGNILTIDNLNVPIANGGIINVSSNGSVSKLKIESNRNN